MTKVTFNDQVEVKEMSVDLNEHAHEVKNAPEHIVGHLPPEKIKSMKAIGTWQGYSYIRMITFMVAVVIIFYFIYQYVGKRSQSKKD